MTRTFKPKKLDPGYVLTWNHYLTDGTMVERTGEVLCRAPQWPGRPALVMWVIPFESFPTDLYWAVVVAKCNSKYGCRVHAWEWADRDRPQRYAAKGEFFSSDSSESDTGRYAATAAQEALKVRERS